MKLVYLVMGIAVCLWFAMVSLFGFSLFSAKPTSTWAPRGHSVYHK